MLLEFFHLGLMIQEFHLPIQKLLSIQDSIRKAGTINIYLNMLLELLQKSALFTVPRVDLL